MLDFWYVCILLSLFEDFNMQRLEDLLQDSEGTDGQDFAQQPPLSSWCQRHKEVQQCWQQARPQNLANLFSAENIVQMTCNHCHVRENIIYVSFLQKHSVDTIIWLVLNVRLFITPKAGYTLSMQTVVFLGGRL